MGGWDEWVCGMGEFNYHPSDAHRAVIDPASLHPPLPMPNHPSPADPSVPLSLPSRTVALRVSPRRWARSLESVNARGRQKFCDGAAAGAATAAATAAVMTVTETAVMTVTAMVTVTAP